MSSWGSTWLVCALSSLLSFAALGCQDDGGDDSTFGDPTGDTTGQTGSTSGTSDTGLDGYPLCEAQTIDRFSFRVGLNEIGGSSDTGWPAGHHQASCQVGTITMESAAGASTTTVPMVDCSLEGAPNLPFSLELVVTTDGAIEVPLQEGAAVDVDFWVGEAPDGPLLHAWYTVRLAGSGALQLAAFADDGAAVEPESGSGWLAPLQATFGEAVCPPSDAGCLPGLERSTVEFTDGAQTWSVVGGTSATLDGFVVHLGHAGEPDVCDGMQVQPRVYGLLVAAP